MNVLQRLARYLDQDSRMAIFRCFILSHFNYCALVWHFCGATNTKQLERIQCRALRFVFRDFSSSYNILLQKAELPTLELARKRAILKEVFKAIHHISPPFMWDLFTIKTTRYNLRSANTLDVPRSRTVRCGRWTLRSYGAELWNTLPEQAKACTELKSFATFVDKWEDPPCKCRMCRV